MHYARALDFNLKDTRCFSPCRMLSYVAVRLSLQPELQAVPRHDVGPTRLSRASSVAAATAATAPGIQR